MDTVLSCSALNFVSGRLNNEQLMEVTLAAIPVIKASGFPNMEVYIREAKGQDLARLLKETRVQNINIQSVHFSKPLLNHQPDRCLNTLSGLINAAAFLGATVGVLHPPGKLESRTCLDNCRKVLETALPIAETQSVILALENLGSPQYLALLAQLINEYPSPNLGITLDLKFLYASGHSLDAFFQVLGQKIVNVHINEFTGSLLDTDGHRQYPQLGKGIVDFVKLAQLIRSYRCSGIWTLETLLNGDQVAELAQAKAFMAELLEFPERRN
ncbi:MAG TPA: sugar phosphate isomerase/epimerase family protein [Bacillota bacterium]|nr:sugar phosphate isomerase/epimerase family protein [Bacillota bacterium]